jgi:hypothetical protein
MINLGLVSGRNERLFFSLHSDRIGYGVYPAYPTARRGSFLGDTPEA